MDQLSCQILKYHQGVAQKKSTLVRKLTIRSMLAARLRELNICSENNPMSGIYIVGSTLNGFAHEGSDLDLCFMMAHWDIDQHTLGLAVLQKLRIAFRDLPQVASQDIICAKTPILQIRFTEPFDDIIVDLNVNNPVAIRNSHLLCHYANEDPRVRPLVSVIKEWAKRQGLKDPNRSSFSSYCLVLMVIHYLQCGVVKPVVPTLHRTHPHIFTSMSHPNPDLRGSCHEPNTQSLGDLLIGFFDYFGSRFKYGNESICIRTGHRTRRDFVISNSTLKANVPQSQWRYLCIEEPFTLNNAAHSIFDEGVFEAIHSTIKNSHALLLECKDLHTLFKMTPPVLPLIVPKSPPPVKISEFVLPAHKHGTGAAAKKQAKKKTMCFFVSGPANRKANIYHNQVVFNHNHPDFLCCGVHVRRAAMLIAYITIAVSSAGFFGVLFDRFFLFSTAFDITRHVAGIVCSFLMIYGISKKKERFMIPFCIYQLLSAAIAIICAYALIRSSAHHVPLTFEDFYRKLYVEAPLRLFDRKTIEETTLLKHGPAWAVPLFFIAFLQLWMLYVVSWCYHYFKNLNKFRRPIPFMISVPNTLTML